MVTIKDIEIPIYLGEGYGYIRTSDIEDKEDRKRLEDYIAGQTRPLPYVDDTTVWDAVYTWDYLNFLNAKKGGFVSWD